MFEGKARRVIKNLFFFYKKCYVHKMANVPNEISGYRTATKYLVKMTEMNLLQFFFLVFQMKLIKYVLFFYSALIS